MPNSIMGNTKITNEAGGYHEKFRIRVQVGVAYGSDLDHELLCWVIKPVFRGRVLHQLNTAVYKRFIQEGIEIPFPQRDVHVCSVSKDKDI